MTIKLFSLASLMVFSTVLFLAIVILEDPPAFFGYFLGTTTGAGWATFFLLWLRSD